MRIPPPDPDTSTLDQPPPSGNDIRPRRVGVSRDGSPTLPAGERRKRFQDSIRSRADRRKIARTRRVGARAPAATDGCGIPRPCERARAELAKRLDEVRAIFARAALDRMLS